MVLRNKVESILVSCWRKNSLLLSSRTFATGFDYNRILKSPSLVSLDFPDDVWTCTSTNYNEPFYHKLGNCLLCYHYLDSYI